jgi:hypothetical protein
MWVYVIIILLCFSIGIFIGFISFTQEQFVKKNLYLAIPIICIAFWAIYFHLTGGFWGKGYIGDFYCFYTAGRYALTNPTNLYNVPGLPYVYLPSWAMSFSITISLFPFQIAYIIYNIIIFLVGAISIFEFNKILKLMDVKKQIHRFMFLIIISNGYFVYTQFKYCQFKFIILLIFLIIIRREIQYRNKGKEKDLKFYIINYAILVYAIGIAPYLIFLVFIYVFHDIGFHELIDKVNIQKYFILLILFILENFLFVIYPSLIFDFLKCFYHPTTLGGRLVTVLYMKGFVELSKRQMTVMLFIFYPILAISTIVLILYKGLKIEEKFSFFLLAFLFFGLHSHQDLLALVLFGIILLLFAPFLKQDVEGIEFIKVNKLVLIGIFSIGCMFFVSDDFIFIHFTPMYLQYDLGIIWIAKVIILHIVMVGCIAALYIQKYRISNIEKKLQFRILFTES